MKIVFAFEGMWIVVDALNLNGSVVDFVLSAAEVSGSVERLEWLLGDDMATKRIFA